MNDYLNVVEVEAAMVSLRNANQQLCSVIQLPSRSAEERTSHALRISTAPEAKHETLVVTAGLHACEWGTSDAAIAFATDLLAAYTSPAGLRYGGKEFSKEAIRAFLESRDLIVFPLVNPDGRAHSQANDAQNRVAGWRKNRRYLKGRGRSALYGVDVNRNFETAWEFERLFIADTAHVSDNPSEDDYHGPEPFSEAESRNVRSLLDQYPTVRWLVDVHGPAQCIQYNWGIDQTQSLEQGKNFRNVNWDRLRGERNDAYGEHKPSEDADLAQRLAERMSAAVLAVRGSRWPAGPAFDTLYALSGALIDYAYARQFAQPPLPAIHSFVIEHGGSYHPAWPEMAPVMGEICAALLELCVAVT